MLDIMPLALRLRKLNLRPLSAHYFLAVQFVDILFFPFVMLGIERLNIIENFTSSTHFELEYMPYTHSLLATFYMGCPNLSTFFALYVVLPVRIALVIAIGVMSYWFLDLLVHTPDLPLWSDDSLKL